MVTHEGSKRICLGVAGNRPCSRSLLECALALEERGCPTCVYGAEDEGLQCCHPVPAVFYIATSRREKATRSRR